MPKAAAIDPGNWATVHSNFDRFDINELNRVVLDYAQIELESAERKRRRSGAANLAAKLMYWVALVGLAGPLFSVAIFASGGGARKLSEDFSPGFEVPCVYIGCALGFLALLYHFVPWVRSTHRQWDRSLFGFSVFVLVSTVLLLVLILMSDAAAYPRVPLVMAPLLLLAFGIALIVAEFRLYSREKPPAVDVNALTSDEVDVLLALRRQALTTLRSRSIVSYDEFDALDRSPLTASADGKA